MAALWYTECTGVEGVSRGRRNFSRAPGPLLLLTEMQPKRTVTRSVCYLPVQRAPPLRSQLMLNHSTCLLFGYFIWSLLVYSCFFFIAELYDSVVMSPADRMRALNLKLISLGKLYAGTPRYFPLGIIFLFFCQHHLSKVLSEVNTC